MLKLLYEEETQPRPHPYDGVSEPTCLEGVTPATKVLFLDIDGVLNTRQADPEQVQCFTMEDKPAYYAQMFVMSPARVALLNTLTDSEPDLQLVVSSAWRRLLNKSLFDVLRDAGIKGPLLSRTPTALSQRMSATAASVRTNEIRWWVSTFRRQHGYSPASVAVVDDLDLEGIPKGNFELTSSFKGLTDQHRLREILARPFSSADWSLR